jgi:hypothetical protein
MGEKERIVRNSMTLIFVEAIWLLLSSGVFAPTETSALVRALEIVLALGLGVSLIPGMFLNAWIVGLSKRAAQARRGLLLLGGAAIPFLLFALFLTWVLGDLKFLSSVRELGLSAESAQWRLVRNGGTALAWLTMVILNGLTILGSRRPPTEAGSAPR